MICFMVASSAARRARLVSGATSAPRAMVAATRAAGAAAGSWLCAVSAARSAAVAAGSVGA
ncbi:MAG: hypothetical protein R3F65_19475 [bacterium]